MNLFVNGILLMALLAALLMPASEASVSRHVFKHDRYPGKCYVSSTTILNPGEETNSYRGACGRVICENNSEAEVQTCGVIPPPPGCKLGLPMRPNAKYPNCCERVFDCSK